MGRCLTDVTKNVKGEAPQDKSQPLSSLLQQQDPDVENNLHRNEYFSPSSDKDMQGISNSKFEDDLEETQSYKHPTIEVSLDCGVQDDASVESRPAWGARSRTGAAPPNHHWLHLASCLFFVLGSSLYLVLSVEDLRWAKTVRDDQIPESVLLSDDDASWVAFRTAEKSISNDNNRRYRRLQGKYDDFYWSELPLDIQVAGEKLGYTPDSWNNDIPVEIAELLWSELTPEQQAAATLFGYDQLSWDGTTMAPTASTTSAPLQITAPPPATATATTSAPSPPTETVSSGQTVATETREELNLRYDPAKVNWKDLPNAVQFAAQVLGYNEWLWNNGLPPRLVTESNSTWDDLTTKQKQAASVLGYSANTWWHINQSIQTFEEPILTATVAPTLEWEQYDWDELPEEVQQAYTTLGWTEELWKSNESPESTVASFWDELTPEQQQAVDVLGYSQGMWDGLVVVEKGPASWEEYDWEELPEEIQAAYIELGYEETIWTQGGSAPTEGLSWDELKWAQREAAMTIGYTQELWDGPSEAPTSTGEASTKAPADTSLGTEYYDSYWAELPPDIQVAFTTLGWSQELWDNSGSAVTDDMAWADLSPEQQVAATVLGFDESSWDNEPTTVAQESSAFAGENDDIVFLVPSANYWVSRYQIIYFSAAFSFCLMGVLDWCRGRHWVYSLMILAGLWGMVAAMLMESNRTASAACSLISVHLYFVEGIYLLWFWIDHRRAAKLAGDKELGEGEKQRDTSLMSGLWWISPLQLTAAAFFVVGAVLEVILSYFYFDPSSAWSLPLARVFAFASLLWLAASLMYLFVVLVLDFDCFPCLVGGDKLFLKRGVAVDQRQKELADMNFVSPLPPAQTMRSGSSF